jgi:hypothetical protein
MLVTWTCLSYVKATACSKEFDRTPSNLGVVTWTLIGALLGPIGYAVLLLGIRRAKTAYLKEHAAARAVMPATLANNTILPTL